MGREEKGERRGGGIEVPRPALSVPIIIILACIQVRARAYQFALVSCFGLAA